VAQCNYGGRVTDDQDRRLIITHLEDFYTENILDDSYDFSENGRKLFYFCPEEGDMQHYIDFIKEKMPRADVPEIFGLHVNAEISSALMEKNQLLATVLSLLPRTVEVGAKRPEDIIKEKCQLFLKGIPEDFDIKKVKKVRPITYMQSMNTVIQQEVLRYDKLLKLLRNSLQTLIDALDGKVAMNAELSQMFQNVYNNEIPALWMKISYGSLKTLESYLQDFNKRIDFIKQWVRDGAPENFWIAGFFFTLSFFTGVKQNYAR